MGLQYCYVPVLPSNRFSFLNSLIDEISGDETVFVIVKNDTIAKALVRFLLMRGFYSEEVVAGGALLQQSAIGVLTQDNAHLLKNYSFSHLISTISSFSIQECKEKFSYFTDLEKNNILIELIGRPDYQLLQSIRQNIIEISVNKMIVGTLSEETIKKNRITRIFFYLRSRIADASGINAASLKLDIFDEKSLIDQLISEALNYDKDGVVALLRHLFLNLINCDVPSFDFYFEKITNDPRGIIKGALFVGARDGVTEHGVRNYLLQSPDISFEQIVDIQIFPSLTTISFSNIVKERVEQFIYTNQFMGKPITIDFSSYCHMEKTRSRYDNRGIDKGREFNQSLRYNSNQSYYPGGPSVTRMIQKTNRLNLSPIGNQVRRNTQFNQQYSLNAPQHTMLSQEQDVYVRSSGAQKYQKNSYQGDPFDGKQSRGDLSAQPMYDLSSKYDGSNEWENQQNRNKRSHHHDSQQAHFRGGRPGARSNFAKYDHLSNMQRNFYDEENVRSHSNNQFVDVSSDVKLEKDSDSNFEE